MVAPQTGKIDLKKNQFSGIINLKKIKFVHKFVEFLVDEQIFQKLSESFQIWQA